MKARRANKLGIRDDYTPRTIREHWRVPSRTNRSVRVSEENRQRPLHSVTEKNPTVVLLAGLRHPSKDVRCWCAFALGEMAEKTAVSALKRLAASDKRIVKCLDPVARETADALENIQIEKVAHRRKNGCLFCVRP